MQSRFIIIRGPAGVGKTTVARHYADQTGAALIHIDDELQKRGLLKDDGYWIPAKQFLKLFVELQSVIEWHLKEHKDVILEGNFYHQEMIGYAEERFSRAPTIITLDASLETCLTRDQDRENPIGELSVGAVHKLVTRLHAGTHISTEKNTIEQVIKKMSDTLQS